MCLPISSSWPVPFRFGFQGLKLLWHNICTPIQQQCFVSQSLATTGSLVLCDHLHTFLLRPAGWPQIPAEIIARAVFRASSDQAHLEVVSIVRSQSFIHPIPWESSDQPLPQILSTVRCQAPHFACQVLTWRSRSTVQSDILEHETQPYEKENEGMIQ